MDKHCKYPIQSLHPQMCSYRLDTSSGQHSPPGPGSPAEVLVSPLTVPPAAPGLGAPGLSAALTIVTFSDSNHQLVRVGRDLEKLHQCNLENRFLKKECLPIWEKQCRVSARWLLLHTAVQDSPGTHRAITPL